MDTSTWTPSDTAQLTQLVALAVSLLVIKAFHVVWTWAEDRLEKSTSSHTSTHQVTVAAAV